MNQPFIPPAAPAAYNQFQQQQPQPAAQPAVYGVPQNNYQQPAPVAAQPGVATGPLANMLAAMRAAPPPSQYGLGFDHPKGAPWAVGQPGQHDGQYRVRVLSTSFDSVDKGQVYRITVEVTASGNPTIQVGDQREIACFMWNAPARSDAQGYTQCMWEGIGGQGQYPDGFAAALMTSQQPAAGLELALFVSTARQKVKPEPFTKKRLELLVAPVAAPVQAPVQGWPAGVTPPPSLPAGVPAPYVPGAP